MSEDRRLWYEVGRLTALVEGLGRERPRRGGCPWLVFVALGACAGWTAAVFFWEAV